MIAQETGVLPAAAKRRIVRISLGWLLVAVSGAAAYTVLALAITSHQSPGSVLVFAAVSVGITVLVARWGYLTGARLAGDLFQAVGAAFARAKLSWFTEKNRALVGIVAGQSIPALMGVPAHQLQTLILSPLIPLLLLLGVAIVAGPVAMLVLLALLGISFVAQLFAQRALARADAGRAEAEQAAAEAGLEFVDHLELLRSAAGADRAVDRLVATWEAQEDALARTNRAAIPATLVSSLASVLPLGGILGLIVAGGSDDPAAALALIVLTARAAAPLDALAVAGVLVSDLRTTFARYRAVASAVPLPEPERFARADGHRFVVRNVSHLSVLSGVNAEIPEGATVLVSGPTGAGKSLLLSLLMRFDDPDSGVIELGGADLSRISYEELVETIAYVSQDPIVFDGTLAENIRLGNPAASNEEVFDAARRAALGAVIDRSPLGVEQAVGHNGGQLSGGERQRVAIARALLKNAPILILDEATSALDADTEERVAQAIRDLPGTTILVTHREAEAIWRPTSSIVLGDEGANGQFNPRA